MILFCGFLNNIALAYSDQNCHDLLETLTALQDKHSYPALPEEREELLKQMVDIVDAAINASLQDQNVRLSMCHAACRESKHILVKMPGAEYGIDNKEDALNLAHSILKAVEIAWPERESSYDSITI